MPRVLGLISAAMLMPRSAKRVVILLTDLAILAVAFWLAVWLKSGAIKVGEPLVWSAAATVSIAAVIFGALGVYHSVVRYIGLRDAFAILVGIVGAAIAGAVTDDFLVRTSLARRLPSFLCRSRPCSWVVRGSSLASCSTWSVTRVHSH